MQIRSNAVLLYVVGSVGVVVVNTFWRNQTVSSYKSLSFSSMDSRPSKYVA